MADRQSILFITNSELGQSTVTLAVAHEFLLRPSYSVHIVSFRPLEKAVADLNAQAAALSAGAASTATFHILAGKCMKEATGRATEFIEMHPPGLRGAVYAYQRVLPATFASWTGAEYMIGYSSCVEVINAVQPGLVAVDPLLSQGIDACTSLGQKFVVLSPNTFRDHTVREQPMVGALWKFPQICSGLPFPIPWYLIWVNIYLTIRLGVSLAVNPLMNEVLRYRQQCGVQGNISSLLEGFGKAQVLVPSTPDTDLPLVVPSHVTGCGPMLRPCAPVSKTHPELESWLSQGPTVLINLGSHILFDEAFATEFAIGLRVLLDRRPDVQVLWKLKTQGETRERLYAADGGFQVISKELASGRVRIEDWLPTEPIAILQSGHVICMVHHGGSNSYHEAVSAGVPQIVLPVWIDTYDFSTKVEYLGIGVWGSKTAAPRVKASEFGSALVKVIDSDVSNAMRHKAKAISEKRKAEGRVVACEKMIEVLQS